MLGCLIIRHYLIFGEMPSFSHKPLLRQLVHPPNNGELLKSMHYQLRSLKIPLRFTQIKVSFNSDDASRYFWVFDIDLLLPPLPNVEVVRFGDGG